MYGKPHPRFERTLPLGTHTAMGPIPHLRHAGILCPVCIETVRRPDGTVRAMTRNYLPVPVRHGKLFVYALPGGGRIVR